MSEDVRSHIFKYSSYIIIYYVVPWGQTGFKMFILMTFHQVLFLFLS